MVHQRSARSRWTAAVAVAATLLAPPSSCSRGDCGALLVASGFTAPRAARPSSPAPGAALGAAPAHAPPPRTRDGPRRRKKKPGRPRRGGRGAPTDPRAVETWRVYSVEVDPDALGGASAAALPRGAPAERAYLTAPVLAALRARLRIAADVEDAGDGGPDGDAAALPAALRDARVVRRSLDARRRRGAAPRYTYVIDVDLVGAAARDLRLSHKPGRLERLGGGREGRGKDGEGDGEAVAGAKEEDGATRTKPRVLIVGAGPAGLFCALELARSGRFAPVLLERGRPVEGRGKSIGALVSRRILDPESNFSFGEGGAGTWSDGKLTTRIGRNSGPVRAVLETLVEYGAPAKILVEGAPHLGTDNLVKLLRNMRKDLRALGGEVHFGARVTKFLVEDGAIAGVEATCTPAPAPGARAGAPVPAATPRTFVGDAVVLAAGHSARDVYRGLRDAGVALEPKGFAVGFRVEHPQRLINELQYGREWGGRVFTQRAATDAANREHFAAGAGEGVAPHVGTLPVASYRLATDAAWDGARHRGAYSFCMCPGGQIVPSSTEAAELCLNGMSFSRRESPWANSALVVTVAPDDPVLEGYRAAHGALAGLEFQRDMERRACALGGGGLRAPVQRLTDFVARRATDPADVPSSSYRLGTTAAACHDIYPRPLSDALAHAVAEHFDRQMPGFLCDAGLLHGVETRTSSPVRVPRDRVTLEAGGVAGLFPAGEGAGFAGGIVSAAVDGLLVADALKTKFSVEDDGSLFEKGARSSVGFEY